MCKVMTRTIAMIEASNSEETIFGEREKSGKRSL